jgi:hypothetical protein
MMREGKIFLSTDSVGKELSPPPEEEGCGSDPRVAREPLAMKGRRRHAWEKPNGE